MAFMQEIGSTVRLRRMLLATTLLCAPLAPAYAEEAPADAPAAPAADTGGSEIVVTGSRLLRNDLSAPSPTTVVGSDDVKLSGNVQLDKTINEMPQLGTGNTSTVNNGGGSGIAAANLRGLSGQGSGTPTRTLTLVNGKRFIAADAAGNVDMQSIPDALIQRVDIITGGASAVYGSDAIAGAVNFVLKQNFKGMQFGASYGINEQGDGMSKKFDLTVGGDIEDGRGNVTISGSYMHQDGFYQGDRSWARNPLGDFKDANGKYYLGYSGSGNVPGGKIALSSSQFAQLNKTGIATSASGCNASSTGLSGISFGAGGTPTYYCSPGDSFNYGAPNLLQRPQDKWGLTALAHYDIKEHVQAFFEGYFSKTDNNYQMAPDSVTLVTPDGSLAPTTLKVTYQNNSVVPAALATFLANNSTLFDPKHTGTATLTNVGYRAQAFGPRDFYYDRVGFDLTGGLRGDFEWRGHKFEWEIFGQYISDSEHDRTTGTENLTRVGQALSGCTLSTGAAITGCVPYNPLSTDAISSAAVAFVTPENDSSMSFTRKITGASLSGSIVDLPAGPLAVAVGTEYRSDHYISTPSAMSQNGEYGTASPAQDRAYDVKEAFAEMGVPILKDLPFAQELSLEGAFRYSDYSTSAGAVWAYKGGFTYAPVKWIHIRGSYNRAVRAPNFTELYSATSLGYTGGVYDPCDKSQNRTSNTQAICVAQGVAASDYQNFTMAQLGLSKLSGGNTNLKPEKADTFTIGAVISPPWVPRLNITVDYYHIKVNDYITSPTTGTVLAACFDQTNPEAAVCQSPIIVRDSSGQVSYVSTQYQNIGYMMTSGIDGQVDYRTPLPKFLGANAQLSLKALVSVMFNSTKQLPGASPIDCAGYYNNGCSSGTGGFILPKTKINLSAIYSNGDFSWRWSGRMIGALHDYPGFTNTVMRVPAYFYVDEMMTFNIAKKYQFFFGINNLLDTQPPVLGTGLVGDANVDVSLYDINGRRFTAGVTIKF